MNAKLKLIYLIFLFFSIQGFLNAQIIVPPNNSNTSSGCVGFDFGCCGEGDIVLHPNSSDFTDKAGRILISTEHDDNYYTSYQEGDARVRIVAEAPPGAEVFFKVIDPDLDDLSQYETDTDLGDNRDLMVGAGMLSVAPDVPVVADSEGIAEVLLRITSQYSGDNYQVIASCNPDFNDENLAKTEILVAWKRMYVEYDKMYKNGSYLTSFYSGDDNTLEDVLAVDDNSDFLVGQNITIFAPPPVDPNQVQQPPITTTITDKFSGAIVVEDVGDTYLFPINSGIMIEGMTETYDIPIDLIENGFGLNTDGSDGGTFVEFDFNLEGGEPVPKFPFFATDSDMGMFCLRWRHQNCHPSSFEDCTNYIQLVAVREYFLAGSRGVTSSPFNLTILYKKNIEAQADSAEPMLDAEAMAAETLVHEFGHQFDLAFPVVHDTSPTNYPNHENTDQGVMSYDRDPDDNIAEFFIDCIYHIRDLIGI